MEFNKCSRCGNFYISNDLVCPKCKAKDAFEFETFQSHIQENGLTQNLDKISSQTGISVKNLNRFLDYSGYNNYIDGLGNIKL